MEKREHLHCWWEYLLEPPLQEIIWSILKKIKIELPYDPAIPLLGIYPQKSKTVIQNDICTFMFIAVLFTIAKLWKQPQCPSIEKLIKSGDDTMEYYSAIKKNEIIPFVTTWMGLEGIKIK